MDGAELAALEPARLFGIVPRELERRAARSTTSRLPTSAQRVRIAAPSSPARARAARAAARSAASRPATRATGDPREPRAPSARSHLRADRRSGAAARATRDPRCPRAAPPARDRARARIARGSNRVRWSKSRDARVSFGSRPSRRRGNRRARSATHLHVRCGHGTATPAAQLPRQQAVGAGQSPTSVFSSGVAIRAAAVDDRRAHDRRYNEASNSVRRVIEPVERGFDREPEVVAHARRAVSEM